MRDLREFIKGVEELGELRVLKDADWDLEIGAISHLAAEAPEPPALLFDNIKGYPPGYRLLVHPNTTDKRMALMLGLPLELKGIELVRRLRDKLKEPLRLLPPLEVKSGPVLENVVTGDRIDVFKFPTPRWMSGDGGREIGTGDAVVLRDPDGGWINVGAHRIQILDGTTTTIMMSPGKHNDLIRRKYWARGQSCPAVAICGLDPLFNYFAGSQIPWGMPEYDYIGWWLGQPVEVVKGPATGLPIPAGAEIALEGEIVPPEVETRPEGPFSEWTGHYSPPLQESAFRVKSVLHRNNPILLGQLSYTGRGNPNWGGEYLGAAQVWKELDNIVVGVKGVWQHMAFGGPNSCLIISLEQKYGGHAKHAALAAFGLRNLNNKYIIVVDEDIDPSNLREVTWALGLRANPEDFDVIRGTWCINLDPTLSPQKRAAGDFTHSTAIILACKPYHWIKDYPPTVQVSPELRQRVRQRWEKLLFSQPPNA